MWSWTWHFRQLKSCSKSSLRRTTYWRKFSSFKFREKHAEIYIYNHHLEETTDSFRKHKTLRTEYGVACCPTGNMSAALMNQSHVESNFFMRCTNFILNFWSHKEQSSTPTLCYLWLKIYSLRHKTKRERESNLGHVAM
jgi:hypothetical protein